MPNLDDPTVQVDCANFVLPTDVAAEDCYRPSLKTGPGRNLYWAKPEFAGFSASPVTATMVAAAKTAGDLIGPIVGEYSYAGDGAAPIRVDGRNVSVPGVLRWNVKISSITPEAREMARATQDGGSAGRFYIVDTNDQWFGGQNGICNGTASLLLRNKVPTGEADLQTIEGTIEGLGKFDDKVQVSPVPVIF